MADTDDQPFVFEDSPTCTSSSMQPKVGTDALV
jgi:hypothetical protein